MKDMVDQGVLRQYPHPADADSASQVFTQIENVAIPAETTVNGARGTR